MKRIALIPAVLVFLAVSLHAESVMTGLFSAADQVSADLIRLINRDGELLIDGITADRLQVKLGDLFADLTANRLAGRSGFRAGVVKHYASLQYPPDQAAWVLSGNLYSAGAGSLLTLQLVDYNTGITIKGWEFALGNDGMQDLLQPSELASAGIMRDRFEPNDSPRNAVSVTPPFSETGLTLGSADEDWFAFEIPPLQGGRMLIFEAYTGGVMDTYMELYAPGDLEWPRTENDDFDGGNAAIQIPLAEAGTWYLKVRSYSEDEEGDYSLDITLTEGAFGPGEPDEGQELASRLNVGTPPLRKNVDYSSDEDWFRVVLVRPLGRQEVLRIDSISGMDLMMVLSDENGNYIMEDDDSGEDNNPMIMAGGLEAGTYFLVVSAFSGETGPYEIMANVTVPVRDEYEDDNSMITASRIAVNQAPQRRTFSPIGDVDWVSFDTVSEGVYSIGTRGDLDTYLELYDGDGYLVEENDDGEDFNARIERSLNPGTYYLSVSSYGGAGPDDPYELFVETLR